VKCKVVPLRNKRHMDVWRYCTVHSQPWYKMEVSCQFHAVPALSLWSETHWIGGWVVLRAGLDHQRWVLFPVHTVLMITLFAEFIESFFLYSKFKWTWGKEDALMTIRNGITGIMWLKSRGWEVAGDWERIWGKGRCLLCLGNEVHYSYVQKWWCVEETSYIRNGWVWVRMEPIGK